MSSSSDSSIPMQATSNTCRKIRPEPVSEKSLVGSVVEFLHDVVPQAYNNNFNKRNSTQIQEIKEPIEWIHYERLNLNNKIKLNVSRSIISNLLLILGYKTGFSIWCIDLNGLATEVLCIKELQIIHVKLLKVDEQKLLLGVCKFISELKCTISILSLINGECLHAIDYIGEVIDMKSNYRYLVVNTVNRIDGYDLLNNYEHRFTINTCYNQLNNSNPFALGSRWLAFADNRFHVMFHSQGGMSNDIEQSYTATVINKAKSISKGIAKIGESVVNSVVTKTKTTSSTNPNISPRTLNKNGVNDFKDESFQPGICTIIDMQRYASKNNRGITDLHDDNQNWIIAHFFAHQEALYALEFNENGRLLVSADLMGQYFNVFQINSNPFKSTRTTVKHLYSLYRGDTSSKVKDISFSFDSRWLAVSTKRGTTHLFPINCYGGPVNARTHSRAYVVNRTSKHCRTAGFADEEQYSKINNSTSINLNNNNNSSLLTTVNSQCTMQTQHTQTINGNNCGGNYDHQITYINNPKLKSIFEPFVIQALGQIRQTSIYANSSSATANAVDNVTSLASSTNLIQLDNICVVAAFADTRGYLSPEEPRDFANNRLKPISSLFVISSVNGNLIEYILDVSVDVSKTNNKATNDSPILLKITPKAQWPLQRAVSTNEAKYQIQYDSPLMSIYRNLSNFNENRQHVFVNNDSIDFNDDAENNEWIKFVEITTHLGPHRRLFMGPQFIFKTINTNITTTALTPSSASVISVETPLIDLSGDIELNSLDLNTKKNPYQIPSYLNNNVYSCTPTYIDVAPGSFQDDMPVFNIYSTSLESQKSLDRYGGSGEHLIESIADAMNDINPSSENRNGSKTTPAIAINGVNSFYNQKRYNKEPLTQISNLQSPSTPLSQTNGSYCLVSDIDRRIANGSASMMNGGGGSGSSSGGSGIGLGDDDSNASSTFSSLTSRANAPSIENFQFHDDLIQ